MAWIWPERVTLEHPRSDKFGGVRFKGLRGGAGLRFRRFTAGAARAPVTDARATGRPPAGSRVPLALSTTLIVGSGFPKEAPATGPVL